VFTSQLLKGDTEVGHQAGVCTVTSVARGEGVVHRHLTGLSALLLGEPDRGIS
jgi:hypothetical protein